MRWTWPSPVPAAEPRHIWVAPVLALVVLLTYSGLWAGVFQFDDYRVIVGNPVLQSWSAWWAQDTRDLLGIRPLLKLSYLLSATSAWGLSGFHALNLAVHLLCSVLVWAVSLEFLRQAGAPAWRVSAAMASALIFATHPVQTEAVTYISGRSASLMALFYLAALWVYARQRSQGVNWRSQGLLGGLFLLALASKETAVTLPLALGVWELALGERNTRCIWQRQRLVWCLLAAVLLGFFSSASYLAHMQRSWALNSWLGNLATQGVGLAYLLRQWCCPLWLNIDPDLPLLHSGWAALGVASACIGLLFVLWKRCLKRPWILLGVLWFVLHLLPIYLLLPRLDVANERQLYLAAWPLGMLLASEALRLLPQRLALGLLLVLCGTLAWLTHQRNTLYHSEVALWQATARLSPNKARVFNNLGYALALEGRADEARQAYQRALQLDPQHLKARYNLQRLQTEHGR